MTRDAPHLPTGSNFATSRRVGAVRFLARSGAQTRTAREMEATLHSLSGGDAAAYEDLVRHVASCVRMNPARNGTRNVALADESDIVRGTLLETIHATEAERRARFEAMLQEKYDEVVATTAPSSSLQCRRCRSSDVTWEQKQTRSADEAMTVFCVCATCKNRWTIR